MKLYKLVIIFILVIIDMNSSLGSAAQFYDPNQTEYNAVVGDSYTYNDFQFTISDAEITSLKRSVADALPASRQSGDSYPSSQVLICHFQLKNNSEVIKFDIENELSFVLTDEYGNQYSQLGKPIDYNFPDIIPNISYPSLYPGESVQKVLFFESPIHKSNYLILKVNPAQLGVLSEVKFLIPTNKIKRTNSPQIQSASLAAPHNRDDDFNKLMRIMSPQPKEQFLQGEYVTLQMDFPSSLDVPQSIYIISLAGVHQDESVSKQYQLKIPEDHPQGRYPIIVIGKWIIAKQERLYSQQIEIEVVDEKTKCAGDCLANISSH